MKVYSQLIKARFEQVATDLTENIKGLFWQNTTSNKIKYHDGSQVREVVDTDSTQTLSGKTLTSPTVNTPTINTPTISTPSITNGTSTGMTLTTATVNSSTVSGSTIGTSTISSSTINTSIINSPTINTPDVDILNHAAQASKPANPVSGKVKFYFKNDGKAYTLDSSGKESLIGSGPGGGGGSLVWDKNSALPPVDVSQDGIKLEGFDFTESQELFLVVNVPATYDYGSPIRLLSGAFSTLATSGDVHFKADVALISPGVTVLGSYTASYTSTNSAVSAPATSGQVKFVGDIDLTDSLGTVGGTPVSGGDKLRVRLYRSIASESPSAQDMVKLLVNNFEISFTN